MNILVVDDSTEIRLIIKHYLTKFNHNVDLAVDGGDAWEKITNNEYQVIISDWKMPIMNGLELCKKVRAANFKNYIYFILLTGMSGKQNTLDSIKAGIDDFVNKPIDADELKIRLTSAKRVLDLEETLERKNLALKKINEQLNTDLKNATNTQISLLPANLDSKHFTTAWYYKPAVFVGGDTFNYFTPSPDFLVFYKIDISGHGISAAMLSMSLQSTLGLKRGLYGGPITRESSYDLPRVFAENLNKMMLENNTDHYLTMIFGIVDIKLNQMHYVQAGHPHPMFYNKEHDQLTEIDVDGFPIGLIDNVEYETQHIDYKSGDKFVVYSDGINEVDSAITDKRLESNTLYEHFNSIRNLTPNNMIDKIKNTWLKKEQLKALPDDVSILIFEFK
ncbi:fused response regulator/phosphatase [Cocleimonas sp. KMM 6892]|uniref:fused response regulator/phosphatase n=1 Tax=unclassified Cocleimonas TaxID=2639732 RepID=UPI002DBD6651|nr:MULTISPECIES: fused response regulator/phosphatase [unclassified Cocleimonas]MEB8432178.1 fused response regulator/phosphatase [Cocleimonas sp. KMM 6892]MEC4714736.1 fused response regulator/phosphatase [Cocleimonas sp. KMM 6895]MEC4744450.1 fused response regulator/phosphatase [Cocleimonas sp. KMM 6896]